MAESGRRMAETLNYAIRHTIYENQSTNYYVRNYQRIMQNKPNLVRRRRIANERKLTDNNEL